MPSQSGFPETRWSLIGRLGDPGAQATLVLDLYAGSIARYLRRKCPHEPDVEDLIQEVLMHLCAHPELMASATPGSGSRFRHLLMTLAWDEARQRLQERWGRQRHEQVSPAPPEQAAPPDADALAMDRAWAETLLQQAWNDVRGWASDGTLEPDIPEVLQEHLVRGRNLRDCAQRLGLPLATCHRRLARGRTYLQRAIIDRLRQAGELDPQEDPQMACAHLLRLLAP